MTTHDSCPMLTTYHGSLVLQHIHDIRQRWRIYHIVQRAMATMSTHNSRLGLQSPLPGTDLTQISWLVPSCCLAADGKKYPAYRDKVSVQALRTLMKGELLSIYWDITGRFARALIHWQFFRPTLVLTPDAFSWNCAEYSRAYRSCIIITLIILIIFHLIDEILIVFMHCFLHCATGSLHVDHPSCWSEPVLTF